MKYAKPLGLIFGSVGLLIAAAFFADPGGAGEIIRASGASLNGITIPDRGTVTPGSVLATGEHGSALVQFAPDSQINILEKSSVTFRSDTGGVTAQMSAGTIGVRSFGTSAVSVETPAYNIGPADRGALYVVAMLGDATTIVSARRGSVSITQRSSGQKYVLAEGHYAKVADSPQATPPQTSQNDSGGRPPAGLLAAPGLLFLIGVGSGVGVAVVLDKTVLAPPTVSPSSP